MSILLCVDRIVSLLCVKGGPVMLFHFLGFSRCVIDLCFRRHIVCFCSLSPTEIIPNSVIELFCVSEQHDGDSFLND